MPKVRDAMQSYLYLTFYMELAFLSMILSFSLGEQAVGSIPIPRKIRF